MDFGFDRDSDTFTFAAIQKDSLVFAHSKTSTDALPGITRRCLVVSDCKLDVEVVIIKRNVLLIRT